MYMGRRTNLTDGLRPPLAEPVLNQKDISDTLLVQ